MKRATLILAALLANGHKGSFDLVYVDGSHEAPDARKVALWGGLPLYQAYFRKTA